MPDANGSEMSDSFPAFSRLLFFDNQITTGKRRIKTIGAIELRSTPGGSLIRGFQVEQILWSSY